MYAKNSLKPLQRLVKIGIGYVFYIYSTLRYAHARLASFKRVSNVVHELAFKVRTVLPLKMYFPHFNQYNVHFYTPLFTNKTAQIVYRFFKRPCRMGAFLKSIKRAYAYSNGAARIFSGNFH